MRYRCSVCTLMTRTDAKRCENCDATPSRQVLHSINPLRLFEVVFAKNSKGQRVAPCPCCTLQVWIRAPICPHCRAKQHLRAQIFFRMVRLKEWYLQKYGVRHFLSHYAAVSAAIALALLILAPLPYLWIFGIWNVLLAFVLTSFFVCACLSLAIFSIPRRVVMMLAAASGLAKIRVGFACNVVSSIIVLTGLSSAYPYPLGLFACVVLIIWLGTVLFFGLFIKQWVRLHFVLGWFMSGRDFDATASQGRRATED